MMIEDDLRAVWALEASIEDRFLAEFDEAVRELTELLCAAYVLKEGWREQVRAALAVLLAFFEDHPALARLVVVEALGEGPRVLAHRARVLGMLEAALDGRENGLGPPRELAPLVAEGVVGALLGVIYTRLVQLKRGATCPEGWLLGLVNPLMGLIVLPYLGRTAADRELSRPAPEFVHVVGKRGVRRVLARGPLEGLQMRMTHRTLQTLQAIAARPGLSNREVCDLAGVRDQGQMSKLLQRLEGLGLIRNSRPASGIGLPNAWSLTSRGEGVRRSMLTAQPRAAE